MFLLPGLEYRPSTRRMAGLCIARTRTTDSPQSAHATGFQDQRGLIQWLASPAHGECAEDVPMRNNQDITFWLVRVLEAGTVVFLLDLGDQGIKTADDIFR